MLSWLASLPWRPVIIGAVGSLLATVLIVLFTWGVKDENVRDIGIVAIGGLTVVGYFFALVFSPWLRGHPASQPARPSNVKEALDVT